MLMEEIMLTMVLMVSMIQIFCQIQLMLLAAKSSSLSASLSVPCTRGGIPSFAFSVLFLQFSCLFFILIFIVYSFHHFQVAENSLKTEQIFLYTEEEEESNSRAMLTQISPLLADFKEKPVDITVRHGSGLNLDWDKKATTLVRGFIEFI